MNRPNILFAIADDASHMSAYGYKFVNTPSFNRVASEGVLFKNAFTTNPKCAPSRASILTGMHTWQLENACTHNCEFPNKFLLYPDLLEQSGYYIGYTGKGWAPGDWRCSGLKRNPAGPVFNKKTLIPPVNTLISNNDYSANFKDFLEKRPQGKPFYFWYGGHEPHRHYVEGEGVRNGKNLEEVEVPSYLPDSNMVRSDLCDYAYEIDWFDMHLGEMLRTLEKIGELDNTIIVVTSDNGAPFPRLKGQMYEQDLNLPLAICWKNKVMAGRVIEDIVSFIDFAPTFLAAAGLKIPEVWPGTSLMDILFSDKGGIVNPQRNRAYMGKERHDVGREGDKGYPVRCIRTPQYLYIHNFATERWPSGNPETWYTNCDGGPTKKCILHQHAEGDNRYYHLCFAKRPEEELYDIVKDPECMNNLANKQSYKDVKKQLWNELNAKLKETNDPRIYGKGDIFNSYKYVQDSSHSWERYVNGTWQCQKF